MVHELKEHPMVFEDVIAGAKQFEVRKFDRPYKVGDLLALNEYNPQTKEYTNRCCVVYIDYVLNSPEYCKDGFVILGIKPCVVCKKNKPISEYKYDFDYTVPVLE